MKSSNKKKKPQFNKDHRPSTISVVSLSAITEDSLNVWKSLPNNIRRDSSMVPFQRKNDKLLDKKQQDGTCSTDYDPVDDDDDDDEDVEKGVKFADTTDGDTQHKTPEPHQRNRFLNFLKIALLLACWATFTYFMMRNYEKEFEYRKLPIPAGEIRTYEVHEHPVYPRVGLIFEGTFLSDFYDDKSDNFLYMYLSLHNHNGETRNISKLFKMAIVEMSELDKAEEIERRITIKLDEADYESLHDNKSALEVNLFTNMTKSFAVNFAFDHAPLDKDLGIILAAVVLIGLYVLIVFELVHRTFAAIIASTMAIGILAAMHERPTMAVVIAWIDVETLLLLFGMMILVAILSQTGVFDYLAVYAFKITSGRVWPLIICLCLFTGILSSILDNVTTILLMTPVTIRLCEVMQLNPVPILMFSVIYSNIGGALTPVGDPPNVIISSNSHIVKSGVNFANFTLHMAACVILVMIQTYFQLRFMFRDMNSLRFTDTKAVQELKHQIGVWQRAISSLSVSTRDGDLVRKSLLKKVEKLNRQLEQNTSTTEVPNETYQETLVDLQAKYPIKNKPLLIKSCITLVFVVAFFFLHSAPSIQKLSLGWTALLGAVLLLILYDRDDIEAVLEHVEWATLLFFAALFVLMEALTELGLISWIGDQTKTVILSVGEESRLAVAILIILWVSALASAFVDNIPLTTMMIKIVISLSENEELGLPLHPLVWSLALGACLGGNGTLIGASANVVCAGVAEKHGYKFTFNQFFKVGFPVMIGGIVVATGYLMVAHVLFAWH